jgi:phosphoglycolate phosphatase
MAYRGVVFDLDGTLLDTLEDLADSMNQVLLSIGLPVHPVEAYKGFVGDGVEMLVRRTVAPWELTDAQLDQVVAEMKRVYGERGDPKTQPYPGVPQLLDCLAERGLTMAVLSNKPHEAVLRLAARHLDRWPFSRIWGAQVGVPKKPDPTSALQLCTLLDIPAEQWLYLGDTSIDMSTASAAGMTAVGVLWGFRDAYELRASGAVHLIEAPLDLVPLLR